MSLQQVLYTAHATSTGGRAGSSASDDGRLSVTLSVPKSMGGDDGPGTNPEQLFAAGYSACFLGALKLVAGQKKVTIPADTGIQATLNIHIPGLAHEQATALVQAAHSVCPYSNATRGNIDVTLNVV
jgi:osmotically inducible protein OsmC